MSWASGPVPDKVMRLYISSGSLRISPVNTGCASMAQVVTCNTTANNNDHETPPPSWVLATLAYCHESSPVTSLWREGKSSLVTFTGSTGAFCRRDLTCQQRSFVGSETKSRILSLHLAIGPQGSFQRSQQLQPDSDASTIFIDRLESVAEWRRWRELDVT